MKKKVLAVVFPVVLAIACSLAVWANEGGTPRCDHCAKMQQSEAKPCCNKKSEQQAAVKSEQQAAEKPCCNKDKQKAAAAAVKPCCDKEKQAQQPAGAKPCCNKDKQESPAAAKPCCNKDKQAQAQ
jgi:hypothetical protein